MPELVGYLLLFVAVGAGFIFVHLLAGKFVRPDKPYDEKMTIYECGEPTIGSAWVQFDVRYYVIALLFVIFDVEVAFFFPWAVVFGKLNDLAKPGLEPAQRVALTAGPAAEQPLVAPYPENAGVREEFATELKKTPITPAGQGLITSNREAAQSLARIAFLDIAVFFGVLLVGYAYLWRRGDLNWVRSVAAEETPALTALPLVTKESEKTLAAAGQSS